MLNKDTLQAQLSQLPLYACYFIKPSELEFSPGVRWVCENECPMYGTSWACPPGVGGVDECEKTCKQFENCLIISTAAQVSDIANIEETLATRIGHEENTDLVGALLKQQGQRPYILSTQACSICESCAYPDGSPCRHTDRMHPCIESHGINLIPVLEKLGVEITYGGNIVTWYSLLFY